MGLRLCVSLGPARSAETLPRMPSAAHEPRPSRPTRRLVPGVELHRTHVPARTRYAVHSGKPDELVRRAALALPGFFVERPLRQWTLLPSAVFLGAFAFTFAIRCLQPDIIPTSD